MGDFEFEDYDFSFAEETSPSPSYSRPKYVPSEPRLSSRQGDSRETTSERTEEILRRSAAAREAGKEDENFSSIASSWDNIMKDFKVDDFEDNVVTASVDAKQDDDDGLHLTTTSMSEDSFELSSTDFEVGVFASKRTQEKAQLRNSTASPSSSMPLKLVSSPEVTKVWVLISQYSDHSHD